MLYFHYTEKLIGLQDLIVKNVAQDQNSTTIFAQMPRKPHNCPCCHTSTTVLTGGGGQRTVKLPPILPNSVQGGAKHQSHVNIRWFDRLKIVPKMQKIAWFQAIFLVSTLPLTYVFALNNWYNFTNLTF